MVQRRRWSNLQLEREHDEKVEEQLGINTAKGTAAGAGGEWT